MSVARGAVVAEAHGCPLAGTSWEFSREVLNVVPGRGAAWMRFGRAGQGRGCEMPGGAADVQRALRNVQEAVM
jgi:hypothetical protein